MSYFNQVEAQCCCGGPYIPTHLPESEQKTITNPKEPTVRELITKVAEMDSKDGSLQSNFVIEECAELIIEMARTYRPDKTNEEKIFDEACDALATIFVVLYHLNYNEDEVRERIRLKYKRCLENNMEVSKADE